MDEIIWHEFISEGPLKEIAWAEKLADASEVPMAFVGLVDFADPDLPRRLLSVAPFRTSLRCASISGGTRTIRFAAWPRGRIS